MSAVVAQSLKIFLKFIFRISLNQGTDHGVRLFVYSIKDLRFRKMSMKERIFDKIRGKN